MTEQATDRLTQDTLILAARGLRKMAEDNDRQLARLTNKDHQRGRNAATTHAVERREQEAEELHQARQEVADELTRRFEANQRDRKRGAEHAQLCEAKPVHGWSECPDFGWDDEGMFIRPDSPLTTGNFVSRAREDN